MSSLDDIDSLLADLAPAQQSRRTDALDDLDDLLASLPPRKKTTPRGREDMCRWMGYKSLWAGDASFYRFFGQPGETIHVDWLHTSLHAPKALKLAAHSGSIELASPPQLPSDLWMSSRYNDGLQQLVIQVESDEDVYKDKHVSKGVIWIPTAKTRPGASIKGFVLTRSINALLQKMNLSTQTAEYSLILYNSQGTEKRKLYLKNSELVSTFDFPISTYDRDGEWKLVLRCDNKEMDSKVFKVEYFEKPDIELITSVKSSYARGTTEEILLKVKQFYGSDVCYLSKIDLFVSCTDEKGFVKVFPVTSLYSQESKNGTYKLTIPTSDYGLYSFDITITDPSGREYKTGSSYQVKKICVLFEMNVSIISNSLIPGGAKNIKPHKSIVQITISSLTSNKDPLCDIPYQFKMIGEGQYWEYTEKKPSLQTQKDGKETFSIKFLDIPNSEPFFLLAKTEIEGKRYEATSIITVVDWKQNDIFLRLDKAEYSPGDDVCINVELVNINEEELNKGTKLLTADVVDGRKFWVSQQIVVGESEKGELKFRLPEEISPPCRLLVTFNKCEIISFDFPLKKKPNFRFEASVEVPSKIDTGKDIQMRFKFPEPTSKPGKIVSWLVDRRIKRHPDAHQYLTWDSTFSCDPIIKPVLLEYFQTVPDWSRIIKESVFFETEYSNMKWTGWAFKYSGSSANIIVINTNQQPSYHLHNFLLTYLTGEGTKRYELLNKIPAITEWHVLYTPQYDSDLVLVERGSISGNTCNMIQHLKDCISALTKSYIPHGYVPYQKALDALRQVYDRAYCLKDAMCLAKDLVNEYAVKKIVRENFVEVEFKEIEFAENTEVVPITFKGTDAITEYDLYTFAICVDEIWCDQRIITVKNDHFTQLKNPAQMVFGDVTTIISVFNNTTEKTLQNVVVTFESDLLKCTSKTTQVIDLVPPLSSIPVKWPIVANGVGKATLKLTSKVGDYFEEIMGFDTPLQIIPPGEPVISRETTALLPGKSKTFEVSMDPEQTFCYVILGILPLISSGILIEGLSTLAQYPYGCCEQAYSSTLPNYILWSYMKNQEVLDEDFMVKLKNHMIYGKNLFMNSYRRSDGGFSLWSSGDSSVFHTALVLSLFGLLSKAIEVDPNVLKQSVDFLKSKQDSKGCWTPGSFTYTVPFPDTTLSTIGITSYIFHGAALAGVLLSESLVWLKENLFLNRYDTTCVALVLDGISRLNLQKSEQKIFCENIRLILLNDQNENGSWGDAENPGSSLSGVTESTAYAIMALIHSFPEDEEVISSVKKAVDYLLKIRRGTGWSTTRDTLYASWAIGEAGDVLWKPKQSHITILVNGETRKSFDFDPKNKNSVDVLCQMREVHIDKLNEDANTIQVQSSGCECSILFEIKRYFMDNKKHQEKVDNEVFTAQWQETKLDVGQRVSLRLSYNPRSPANALMVEIPIPSGFEIDSLDDNVSISSDNSWHKEINTNNKMLACFTSCLKKRSDWNISFMTTLSGVVYANPCRAFPMYQPDNVLITAIQKITIQ